MEKRSWKPAALAILIIVTIPSAIFAQKQGNVWIFGEGGKLDFNSGTPVPFSGSQIVGNPTQTGDYLYSEGCASISDSSGALLFYSNGMKIWNKLDQLMPNGDSLKGFYSSTSAAFIVPAPQSDSLYYLFTTDGLERKLAKGLRYSIINRCLDNGKGDIIANQKNIPLLDTVSEKLCAVVHPNGNDIWLIAHKHFTNKFYAYLITASGIQAPVITSIGSVHPGDPAVQGYGTAIGQMKASSDGSKIALVFSNTNPAVAELFQFNAATGILSNTISLQTNGSEYGLEFSPDNSKLYTTGLGGLNQFDISSDNQTIINASKTQISAGVCLPSPLQLGPDGKIYVARCGTYLGVINNPNNSGTACNYVNNAFSIAPAHHNTSLPLFIAGYHYKNKRNPVCSSLELSEISLNTMQTVPNPANERLEITTGNSLNDAVLSITDCFGKKVRELTHLSGQSFILEREHLPAGLYFVHLIENQKMTASSRILFID